MRRPKMKLTLTDQQIKDLPSGCDCVYIPGEDGFGFKVYRNKETRDRAYLNQLLFARFGLAPECWDPFKCEIKVPDCEIRQSRLKEPFGYVTEAAHVLDTELFGILRYDGGGMSQDNPARYRFIHPLVASVEKETMALHGRARKHGLYWTDSAFFNLGMTEDGRVVVIDTASSNMIGGGRIGLC